MAEPFTIAGTPGATRPPGPDPGDWTCGPVSLVLEPFTFGGTVARLVITSDDDGRAADAELTFEDLRTLETAARLLRRSLRGPRPAETLDDGR